jgi:hypothetical protein
MEQSRINLLLLGVLMLPASGFAQSSAGIRFIAQPFTPDAVALTEMSAAHGSFTYAAFANPAVQGKAKNNRATISQNIWPGIQNTSYVGAVLPGETATWGFSLLSNMVDGIEARTVPGDADGTFSARYTAVSGTVSKTFGPLSVGMSGTLLNESIYEANAGGWAVSGGMAVSLLENRLHMGSAILNYGEMNPLRTIATELPARWQTGVWADAINFSEKETGFAAMLLSVKADVIVPLEDNSAFSTPGERDPWISLGGVFEIDERFLLRAGWRSGETTRPFSMGAGVRVSNWQADYALTRQQNGIGAIHSIGVTMLF